MADNRFCVDYGKRQAGCKKCKQKIEKGEVRIAKITANPFSDEGDMKNYHHPACIFETFKKARATTKIIEDAGDLEGWADIQDEDKKNILEMMKEIDNLRSQNKTTPKKKTPKKTEPVRTPNKEVKKEKPAVEDSVTEDEPADSGQGGHKDNSFRQFQKICKKVADIPSYNTKTEVFSTFFNKGTEGKFQGDLHTWVRLLIPGVVKRTYNMQNKQLVKIFSRIFEADEDDMLEDLEQGDVSLTVSAFFEKSKRVSPKEKGTLSLGEVDKFLEDLAKLTHEQEQQAVLARVVKRSTVNDLKMFVRLLKGDLKMQAGAKHVLDGLHPDAHEAFNSSRNIRKVIDKVLELKQAGNPRGKLEIGATLMQPVQPMLAAPCKSVDMAFKKCPNGMYSEIKYDGERVQLHKLGKEFKYFSRSLKPVMPHKVKHFKEFIPKAFPKAADIILDAEVLMVESKTGKPLPFGTLGIHKGSDFKDAYPCLFIFDCLFYNGVSLMHRPLVERRQFLVDNMTEVENRIKLSEIKEIRKRAQLTEMIQDVFKQGLEGLMIKDVKSVYEPGKRHWLKIKKDYLNEGAMADSADLVVLGGWYGSGQKGGMISIFLMGCRDPVSEKWCTVTKVHTGHDDATLEKLQGELLPKMKKIKGDFNQVPGWLKINRTMVPDFLAKDPEESPVWEITGAEFSKAELHTARGISIRFPRVTKIRDDKTIETATNLLELEELYKESKNHIDINLETSESPTEDPPCTEVTPEKRKTKDEEEKMDTTKRVKKEVKEEQMEVDNPDSPKYSLTERSGDLFKAPTSSSLAHCISRDCKLGKGIALLFRQKFGRVDEIEAANADIGEIAVLKDRGRFIYNLVTKEKYYGKPTYETLRRSLERMKEHAVKHKVRQISMPLIGCGLDKLQWPAVRTLIKNVFRLTDIEIVVYTGPDGKGGGHAEADQDEDHASKADRGSAASSKQTSMHQFFKAKDKKSDSNGSEKAKKSDSTGSEKAKKMKTAVGFGYHTSNPLPDVFVGLKIHLDDQCPNLDTLKRSVVALGGGVVDRPEDASHHVTFGKPSSSSSKGKNVDLKWLEDSIKLQKKQPEKFYVSYD